MRNAAKIRGIELTAEQIEGYLDALIGCDPIAVVNASALLWRETDARAMPTPAALIARIRAEVAANRGRREQLPEPRRTQEEQQFGLECFAIGRRLLSREIDGLEADRLMVQSARRHGQYARICGQDGCAGVL